MKTTDTSEKGLESLIVASLVNEAGYVEGDPKDYDREHAVDSVRLFEFLSATQEEVVRELGISSAGPKRTQFLHRIQGEISKRGVVDVLRKGIKHGPASVDLFYGLPSRGNVRAAKLFKANIFSVTRQLHYSRSETALSLDLALFINGLPVATFELKNRLTRQTVEDAVQQYKRDRDEKELLFHFGRCAVHFAVDDLEVRMCTHLKGKSSWFLPFNKGRDDGAGNPPNPSGPATEYLWKEILSKQSLADILENYAQTTESKDAKSGRKKKSQIFPRCHQLTVVRALLDDVQRRGVGKRYLIQHSAGSGKSNSIAWLAHQLVSLEHAGRVAFDSIIVVTHRQVLDQQIQATIKQFARVSSIVGHADKSADLSSLLKSGKKIIISTVQKFTFILDEIGGEQSGNRFAIIIDEAHSGQGGKATADMNMVLGMAEQGSDDEETVEDKINRIMEGRKMLSNASYFAFTATPKNKTLEIFGESDPRPDGTVRHFPFHSYTMKQAIQEGFILDVLQSYTSVESYYRLIKRVKDDPEFDVKKAEKKLRLYVESHEHAIRRKAEIMVDHFHEQVLDRGKIGGKARAMVVTGGVERAIQYYHAFREYLKERKSPWEALIAFSGEREFGGAKVTEASFNGFPSGLIPDRFQEAPYRFLIVADKFQTGYDEPLLHTMYVDKPLSGVKAVQTLSRLNRAHPQKHDTFVLDFCNDSDTILNSFAPYYRTTILSDETDPNKLHDLKADLDGHQVYSPEHIDELVRLYLSGEERGMLDPILDSCAATYKSDLDEDRQIDFKGKAKAFVRTYGFLASILPYSNAEWEKLSIFLNFLLPKLPAPVEEDLSKGILETIDMESYRAEMRTAMAIALPDEDGEIDPVPGTGGGFKPEPELDRLSNIIKAFNDQFGHLDWKDGDKISRVIAEEIPAKVSAKKGYQNAMRNNDRQTARIEHDAALLSVIMDLMHDHAELVKQFVDNPLFKRWISDVSFNATYRPGGKAAELRDWNMEGWRVASSSNETPS